MKNNFKIISYGASFLMFALLLFSPFTCKAMPPGTLLYRTSSDGKMFGYSPDPLMGIDKGIIKDINSGHAAIYVGKIKGVDYIVEALGGGIVKTPAQYFVNTALGEKFLGAKIPRGLNSIQQAKVVALAKNLADANLAYDFDFKKQKGPASGEWTCVGLTEKLYESANISNPNNFGALEYDPNYYALDITPDGYDNKSVVNSEGDCFSKDFEFSKIARRTNMYLPAPEIIGYDAGLEHDGDRYIFLPYTQFLQPSLDNVNVDINLATSFNDESVRGKNSSTRIALRWSLINNPLSSLKTIVAKVKEVAVNLKDKIFGGNNETALVLNDSLNNSLDASSNKLAASTTKKAAKKKTAKKTTTAKAVAAKKTTSAKKVAAKTTSTKSSASKSASLAKATTSSTKKTSINSAKSTNPKSTTTKSTVAKIIAPKATKTSKTVARSVNVKSPVTVNSAPVNLSNNTGTNSNIVNIPANQNNNEDNSSDISTTTDSVSDDDNSNPDETASSSDTETTDSDIASSSATSTDESPDNNTPIDYPKLAVINRIYSTGDNDFVELFNPTDHDFDLKTAEYRLEKTKTAVTPSLMMRIGDPDDGTYPGGTLIKAHDTYLIVRDDANNFYKNQADAIATRSEFTWTGSGYTLYLGNGAISSSTDQNIIDAVGFGSDAQYFLGSGPAPEIIDNYVLTKTASTSDNARDFSLIFSNEPGLIATSSQTNTPATSTPDWEAYVPPTPINSDGLRDLWHFDECYGNDDVKWRVGKWGCALEVNDSGSGLTASLTPAYDLDNFSFSFNYKRDLNSRIIIDFTNSFNEKMSLWMEQGMIQIEGLPDTQWRYYIDPMGDDDWHQAAVVVSRADHYWAVYIDGQEKIHQVFSAALPNMESLKVWSSQGRILLDELALWPRVLSPEEIASNYNRDAPFSPVEDRAAQKAPVLKHFWHFDEGHGTTSVDSIGNLNFAIPAGIWDASGRLNTAILSKSGNDLSLDLKNSVQGKDYSLSLWWRNSVYPADGRANISLLKDDQKLFGFIPNYYRNSYWFNNSYGIFHEGIGDLIPYDDLWHYLVLTYDSYRYSLNFYVDGEEKASSPLIYLKDGDEPNTLSISSDSDYSNVDELGVWEGALSAKQIKTLYSNTPAFQ